MGSEKVLVACVIIACMVVTSHTSCTKPAGWKEDTAAANLGKAKLVIHAKFDTTVEETLQSDNSTEKRVNVTVKCVLANVDKAVVYGDMSIVQNVPASGVCHDNSADVTAVGTTAVILLKKESDGTFMFDNGVNTQKAIYSETVTVDSDDFGGICGYQEPKLPTGVTQGGDYVCPTVNVTAEEMKKCEETGAGQVPALAMSLILTMLIGQLLSFF